jgi:hypothetical protein
MGRMRIMIRGRSRRIIRGRIILGRIIMIRRRRMRKRKRREGRTLGALLALEIFHLQMFKPQPSKSIHN